MMHLLWPEPASGRQRAAQAVAALFVLIAASTMFLSLTALTGEGADYDCGPAAFALVAGPDRQTDRTADCRRAASQRLTTVAGLATLAVMAGAFGTRLLEGPDGTRDDGPLDARDLLPSDRARRPRPPRRRYPYADSGT
jgi:hypothetical protein